MCCDGGKKVFSCIGHENSPFTYDFATFVVDAVKSKVDFSVGFLCICFHMQIAGKQNR